MGVFVALQRGIAAGRDFEIAQLARSASSLNSTWRVMALKGAEPSSL